MRNIYKLSALIPVLTLSVGQVATASPMPESSTNAQFQPFLIANPFRILRDVVDTVDGVDDIDSVGDALGTVEDAAGVINSLDQTIQAENRRRELEAAREAATEQERLEAERRQRYFESLSPEEQQAYVEEQQAMQAQRDQAATLFLLTILAVGMTAEPEPAPESAYDPYDGVECAEVNGWLSCQ